MLSALIARVSFSPEILNLGLPMGLERLARRRLDPLAYPTGVALREGCGRGRVDEDERDTDGEHASEHWVLLLLLKRHPQKRTFRYYVSWSLTISRKPALEPVRAPRRF